MTVGILVEKAKAQKLFATALGGVQGNYQGTPYIITAASGHLYEFADPEAMVAPDLAARYKSWDISKLPWDHRHLNWKLKMKPGASAKLKKIKDDLSKCDEIVIATDVDPSGEGQLLAWEILSSLGLTKKKITRMNFVDEAAPSIQKAFVTRQVLPPMKQDPEYMKSLFRSKFDLLSMQWTRVASKQFPEFMVLKQGRLKSTMVLFVWEADQAYKSYKRVPFYQNRFVDENGVMYTNPDEPRFATKGEVPNIYQPSAVVLDSRENKTIAPGRLLDLAGLSVVLSKSGVKAKQVLETYQRMYEAQVVSYPRTEDKTVTPEQFNDLLPKIDQIARVVGVDPALLDHRQPRSTHVKPQGAHGANRPGLNVPASLDAVRQEFGDVGVKIYKVLAANYLSMLAKDYVYELQKGHLADYPKFKGEARLPKAMGFRAVFSNVDEEETEDNNAKGLGQSARPTVHEGFPKPPPKPTWGYLVHRLEQFDVGTGATRTSTYADVTNENERFPLIKELKGGVLELTRFGEISARLLPDTHIGDVRLSEKLIKEMKQVAEGKLDPEESLARVADWVKDDIVVMARNAKTVEKVMDINMTDNNEYLYGSWNGTDIRFKPKLFGREVKLTEEQVQALCDSQSVTVKTKTKEGKDWEPVVRLANQVFNGHEYVGLELDPNAPRDWPTVPNQFCGHTFTQEEKDALNNGDEIFVENMVSKKTGNTFSAFMSVGIKEGEEKESLILRFPPRD